MTTEIIKIYPRRDFRNENLEVYGTGSINDPVFVVVSKTTLTNNDVSEAKEAFEYLMSSFFYIRNIKIIDEHNQINIYYDRY